MDVGIRVLHPNIRGVTDMTSSNSSNSSNSSSVANSSNVADQGIQRVATLEYILLGDLRDLLEEPADHLTVKWMTAVLDALLDTLPQETEMQEDGGYMADVLEEFPNWSGHVTRLQLERESLFVKLRTMRRRINGNESFGAIANEVRGDLRDWMNSFTAFHRHERRLVQNAFNYDIGIGD